MLKLDKRKPTGARLFKLFMGGKSIEEMYWDRELTGVMSSEDIEDAMRQYIIRRDARRKRAQAR